MRLPCGYVIIYEGGEFMSNLQETRKRRGITQKALSEKSGVPLVMIQKYEAGIKNIKKAAAITVLKLAQALRVRVQDLIEEE